MLAEQGLLTGEAAQITREELVENIVEQTKAALIARDREGGRGQDRTDPSSSCPALCRASTSFDSRCEDVDGRDKPGHDDEKGRPYACARGSIGVVPRTPRISSSTLAPASSCASPRGGADHLQSDRQAGCGEAAGQRQRRAAGQRDRIDDAEPFDIIVELLAVAFGDVAVLDRERRHDGRRAQQQIVGLEELQRALPSSRRAAPRRAAICSTVSFRPSSIFQITSGLSRSRLVRSSCRLADREVEGAQHMEAFMRLAQIGMRFLDDGAGFRKALRGLAGDGVRPRDRPA